MRFSSRNSKRYAVLIEKGHRRLLCTKNGTGSRRRPTGYLSPWAERFERRDIGFIQAYSKSCALNKKGCHLSAAAASANGIPVRFPDTISATFRANFSRLNFDSGAKILGDIIKYDYPGKEGRKKSGDASQRGRERHGTEEKEKEATRGGRKRRVIGSG